MSNDLEEFFSTVGVETEVEPEGIRQRNSTTGVPPEPALMDGSRSVKIEGKISAWAVNGNVYSGISESLSKIPPGCYKVGQTQTGIFLAQQPLKTDTLLHLPDSKSEQIIEEIDQFQTLRPDFTARGFLFKRGILMWGPPGSGKTATLHLLMDLIVKRCGGIAMIVGHPGLASAGLQLVRQVEPDRQIVAIMEDLDGLIAQYSVEGFLSLLDGEDQIDNVIFVATTNYPERLDRRFVDRPSRFDTVERVGMPTEASRRMYLSHKDPSIPDETLTEMVRLSEGFSIAHLREFIISTQCFKRDLVASAERLRKSQKRLPNSERNPDAVATGFAVNGGGV